MWRIAPHRCMHIQAKVVAPSRQVEASLFTLCRFRPGPALLLSRVLLLPLPLFRTVC